MCCEHPGKEIERQLKSSGMSRKELATRTGVTEKHINTLISGSRDLTVSYASKLALVLPIKGDDSRENAKYWQSLQNEFDLHKLQEQEKHNISDEEIGILKNLSEITEYLIQRGKVSSGLSDVEKVLKYRNLLKISDLTQIARIPYKGAFRAQLATNAKIDRYVLSAWQAICEMEIGADTGSAEVKLDKDLLKSSLADIKNVMFDELSSGCAKLKDILESCGIVFKVVRHFRGAPVQGYIKELEDGRLFLCLTIRGGRADSFWFTLFHEIAHILHNDYQTKFVDFDSCDGDVERRADMWARNFLIPLDDYRKLSSLNRKPTVEDIIQLAKTANVRPFIVLGRLQKDGVLEWSDYPKMVVRYKWVE